MFDSEESLLHLQELRRKAAMIKGEAVEGLPPLAREEENTPAVLAANFSIKKSFEIEQ